VGLGGRVAVCVHLLETKRSLYPMVPLEKMLRTGPINSSIAYTSWHTLSMSQSLFKKSCLMSPISFTIDLKTTTKACWISSNANSSNPPVSGEGQRDWKGSCGIRGGLERDGEGMGDDKIATRKPAAT